MRSSLVTIFSESCGGVFGLGDNDFGSHGPNKIRRSQAVQQLGKEELRSSNEGSLQKRRTKLGYYFVFMAHSSTSMKGFPNDFCRLESNTFVSFQHHKGLRVFLFESFHIFEVKWGPQSFVFSDPYIFQSWRHKTDISGVRLPAKRFELSIHEQLLKQKMCL